MHCDKCGNANEGDGFPATFCRECGEPFIGLQRRRGFLATIIAGIVGAPIVAKAVIVKAATPKLKTVIVRNGGKLKAGDLDGIGDIDTLIVEGGDVQIGVRGCEMGNLRTWEGASGGFNDTTNWSGGAAPKAGDVATFGPFPRAWE